MKSSKDLTRASKSRPKACHHLLAWDLTLFLQPLIKAPFEPFSLSEPLFLTWNMVFLIILLSGWRSSEIHAFTFKGNKKSSLSQVMFSWIQTSWLQKFHNFFLKLRFLP